MESEKKYIKKFSGLKSSFWFLELEEITIILKASKKNVYFKEKKMERKGRKGIIYKHFAPS